MVINICNNSVNLEFSLVGKVRIKAEQELAYIQFKISYTGAGIAEEDIAKIYSPFVQVYFL